LRASRNLGLKELGSDIGQIVGRPANGVNSALVLIVVRKRAQVCNSKRPHHSNTPTRTPRSKPRSWGFPRQSRVLGRSFTAGTTMPAHLAGSPFQRASSCRSRHAPTARRLSAERDVRAAFRHRCVRTGTGSGEGIDRVRENGDHVSALCPEASLPARRKHELHATAEACQNGKTMGVWDETPGLRPGASSLAFRRRCHRMIDR
jgi:hypothetical protein